MNAPKEFQKSVDPTVRYKARIDELANQGMMIAAGAHATANNPLGTIAGSVAAAWLVSATNLVAQICKPSNPYYKAVCERPSEDGTPLGTVVLEVSSVLVRLKEDLSQGLLKAVVEQAQGETLESLLDQAVDYHARGRLEGAGVLVSAVFEDAVRRIASSRELEASGTNLDALITGLERAGVCSAVAARRWRAVAALRNKALHAQWNDFTLQDIGAAITLVKEIVETNLVSPL
jgi:hypothetical protein